MSLGASVALVTERVVEPIEGMHRAIAQRWFGAAGRLGKPVHMAHDAISHVVYGSIRFLGTSVGMGIDAKTAAESPAADTARSFVNGLWGDALGRHSDRLGIPMTIRDADGAAVAAGQELAAVFPAATGQLVLLVHGLVETERCWHGTDAQPGLIHSLDDHAALSPVAIRYNSGLRVSANGSLLAALLEHLHSTWPVPVESISLVGHSMGGLVVRSACTQARTAGHRWIEDVDHVVTTGSPHLGVPLEKYVNVLAWGLSAAPETRPLADLLNSRSVGIKDLRFGAIAEDDWQGVDPNALLRNTVGEHPLPTDIDHHFVAGVVTSNPHHPIGVLIGDLIVRPASSTGQSHWIAQDVVVVGGTHHFDLRHDPAVIARVMGWLTAAT